MIPRNPTQIALTLSDLSILEDLTEKDFVSFGKLIGQKMSNNMRQNIRLRDRQRKKRKKIPSNPREGIPDSLIEHERRLPGKNTWRRREARWYEIKDPVLRQERYKEEMKLLEEKKPPGGLINTEVNERDNVRRGTRDY